MMDEERTALHALAPLENLRRLASGPTISEMDGMTQYEFDALIQRQLEASGFQTLHRAPRVIEIVRSGQRGLVYCANAQDPGRGGMIHLRHVVAARRLLEDDDFSSLLLIGNQPYVSRAALRHMESMPCALHHIDRYELQQWIEWGTPVCTVIDL
ncbi:hypothetical protein Slala05_74690 [Streptomyces lavendulae subsp. lavendulae]|nr:hypothetical protein Slala05_74690 [Streptomyces lavendulae subsp. lavendulae]